CGISKANIYHYYASKDDIIFDILDSYLSQLRDQIVEISRAGLSPQEQLYAITRGFLLAYEGMDNEHKIQGEGLPILAPEKQEILKGYQRDLVGLVSDILQSCAPEKLGLDKTQRRNVTMSVFGMLNWFYMWHPKASEEARIDYAASIADLTLNGLNGK
ncbi:MAG: TetR/AcrR family transcriptional regulator, partial [Pseudomonadota bacterium]